MGFKFKRIDFTAGSAEFPTGTTDALRRTRSENVLKAVAESVIASNAGWILDANRNATVTDYSNVPTWDNSKTFPGLFFVNTISGCKLFMAYFGGTLDNSYAIKDFGRVNDNATDIFGYGKNARHAGLICSIIPDGSNSQFGSSFDSSFLPSDATRLIGTLFKYTYSSFSFANAYDPTASNTYSWGIYISPYAIAISANYGNTTPNLLAPVYATGRIIGTVAHQTDSAVNSKYGVVIFKRAEDNEGKGNMFINSANYSFGLSGTIYAPGVPTYSSDGFGTYTSASIAKADGTWLNANNNDGNVNALFYTSDLAQLSGRMYNSTGTGKSRWVPLAVAIISADINTDGVVPGDGFKGYLDTDLFRCARGTYGQQFDNGNFICPQNDYNLLIGWNPDNTDSLAGA